MAGFWWHQPVAFSRMKNKMSIFLEEINSDEVMKNFQNFSPLFSPATSWDLVMLTRRMKR